MQIKKSNIIDLTPLICVVGLFCIGVLAIVTSAAGQEDPTAPIRMRAEALIEVLRSEQWSKVAPFVIVSTGKAAVETRRRMGIPQDASPDVVREKVGQWFKQIYGSVKPGRIVDIRLRGTDLAQISYRHDDIDAFHMRLVDGDWYYTLDD
jgi:hypothetical protein